MTWLTAQFIRAASLYKNPENPWWRRGIWALVFTVLGSFLLLRWVHSKKRMASLEADVEIYQQKAITARELAKADALLLQADKLHIKADKFEDKARKAEEQWSSAVDSYGETSKAIEAAQDWDTLKETYDVLE